MDILSVCYFAWFGDGYRSCRVLGTVNDTAPATYESPDCGAFGLRDVFCGMVYGVYVDPSRWLHFSTEYAVKTQADIRYARLITPQG